MVGWKICWIDELIVGFLDVRINRFVDDWMDN